MHRNHLLTFGLVAITLSCGVMPGPVDGGGGGAGGGGGGIAVSPAEQAAFDAAKADYIGLRYSAAQAEFQAFLATYPRSSLGDKASFYLGRCKYEAAPSPDYAGAIAVWKAMATAFPQSPLLPEAQYWVGRAYFQNNDYANARTELSRQLATYPNNAFSDVVGLYLARCDFETAQFAAAQARLTQLLAVVPASPWSADMLYWRGRSQWSQQAFVAARADFDRLTGQYAMSVLADNASYWAGRCLFSQASLAPPTATWADTVAAFDRTYTTYPMSNVRDWVLHYKGRAQFENLAFPAALDSLNLQLNMWSNLPSRWAGHYWRGRVSLKTATPDTVGALADFDAVIAMGGSSVWYGAAFEWKARTQADLGLCDGTSSASSTYLAMKAAFPPPSPSLARTCAYVLTKCVAQICP